MSVGLVNIKYLIFVIQTAVKVQVERLKKNILVDFANIVKSLIMILVSALD
jgi:hypothetical protein